MTKMKLVTSSLMAVALLAGCATATVEKPAAQVSAPAMNIPVASSKKVVLNLQLDPKHPQDKGWSEFRQEWIDITKEQATAKGVQITVQDGEPKPTGEAATLMVVRVNDYRHVGVGARIMLGVMTGNAFIDAKVEFRDAATGALYGERSYNTTSSAWSGVFAAMTPKQIYAIADETLAELARR